MTPNGNSLVQSDKSWSAYDNWAQTHPILNWSLAFIVLIGILIVLKKLKKGE